MSLYDELQCHYPLPDGFDAAGEIFQTRDTPEQYFSHYVLTQDGQLQDKAGEDIRHHGALTFYTSNICGAGPRGFVTRDDTPPWVAEYCALFDHGVLLKIEGQRQLDTTRPHLSRAEFYATRREKGEEQC